MPVPVGMQDRFGNWVNLVEDKGQTVTASQTSTVLANAGTGAAGDFLAGITLVPATTSPGAVSFQDGAGTVYPLFAGGASSVSNLLPCYVPVGLTSKSGAWKVSTGANVSVIAAGNF